MLSQHQISYIIKHIGLESNNFDCGKTEHRKGDPLGANRRGMQ